MPADASIYSQLRQQQPVNALGMYADALQLQGARQNQQLNALKMDEYQRGVQEANTLRDTVRGFGANEGENVNALLRSGNLKAAQDYQKANADRAKLTADAQKTQIETAGKRLDLAGQAFGWLRNNPTVENANSVLDHLTGQGVYTPEQAAQSRARLSNDPAEIARLATLGFQAALNAKDQLPKFETQNLGGTSRISSIDPVTGRPTVVSETAITQSADNAATNAQSAANNQATVGVQYARLNFEKEKDKRDNGNSGGTTANPATFNGQKPPAGYRWKADGPQEYIPGGSADPARTGEKSPTEGERKAATLLKRLEGSQAQLNAALESSPKETKPGMLSTAIRGVGSETLANTVNSPVRQRIEAAQLDMLDAALTLGTGAAYTKEQLEGYRKSYFPQIGDDPSTIRDKQARLLNVIDAAKIAAGRAAPLADSALKPKSPTSAFPSPISNPASLPNGWSVKVN